MGASGPVNKQTKMAAASCNLARLPTSSDQKCRSGRILRRNYQRFAQTSQLSGLTPHTTDCKTQCKAIMEDVNKLDNIQDGFIHYQLIRFCQATRLQSFSIPCSSHKIKPPRPGLGRHAAARVPRRGRFRSPQQHRQPARGVVVYDQRDQRQVCCLPGHLCPPSSTGLAAGQRHPGSIHLGCSPLSHANAPARLRDPLQHTLLRSVLQHSPRSRPRRRRRC